MPDEALQREHELTRALEAARSLQDWLEMLGDRAADVAVVVSLRHSLARDMAAILGPVELEQSGDPMADAVRAAERERTEDPCACPESDVVDHYPSEHPIRYLFHGPRSLRP